MLFVGESDDVVRAFREHVASSHEYSELVQSIEDALQNVVFVGVNRAYIGETFDQLDSQSIEIPGPGFVIRRFDEVEGVDGAAGVTVDCHCAEGLGFCVLKVSGGTAKCLAGSCSDCRFVVTAPTHIVPPETILKADWLVEPPDAESDQKP